MFPFDHKNYSPPQLPHVDSETKCRSISAIFNHANSKGCVTIAKPNLPTTKVQFSSQACIGQSQKARPVASPNKITFGFRRALTQSIPKNLLDHLGPTLPPVNPDLDKVPDLLEQIIFTRGKYIPDGGQTASQNQAQSNDSTPIAKLYDILVQSLSISSLNEKVLMSLLEMAKNFLTIAVPEIPPKLIFCDQIAQLTLENWSEFHILHKIVLILIRDADPRILGSVFTPDFIHALVGVLSTPDQNEQTSLEVIINAISEKFPETRELFFQESIDRLVHHIHHGRQYFCVSSCLKYLLDYFKYSAENLHSPDVFERSIFPLFSSYFLAEFYPNLNAICSMFYGMFDHLPLTAMKFLLAHWPQTHTGKQVIFIRHIAVIAPFLSATQLQSSTKGVMEQIARCLRSSNYKIISAALQLVSDATFLYLFSAYSETVIKTVYPAMTELSNHWCPEVANKYANAVDILGQMNPQFIQAFDVEKIINEPFIEKKNIIQNSWEMIATAADRMVSARRMKDFKKEMSVLDEKDFKLIFLSNKSKNTKSEEFNDIDNENEDEQNIIAEESEAEKVEIKENDEDFNINQSYDIEQKVENVENDEKENKEEY